MLRLTKLPDLFSILNAVLGFGAILLALDGIRGTGTGLATALVLILLAAVIDGLDGIVARALESSLLGEFLDSLADMVSFGVAPAILAYAFITDYSRLAAPYGSLALAVGGAYITCGMLRLARFNANLPVPNVPEQRELSEKFLGFPITGSATFLASFILLMTELPIPSAASAKLLLGVMALLCYLMTSRIPYQKLRDRRITVPVGLLFLALFLAYLFSFSFVYLAFVAVALTAFYMCSPLLYTGKEKVI
ncbi:MAG: CDP-alcohol phosphatidyltransferase family protein [Methanomicrobia archaeon]|nr:CDP-alcohol phosphatidyltransferase family protein [Methanomicrobia archaeon]